jgi:hypothetical protein
MKKVFIIVVVLFACLFLSSFAYAAGVPTIISYQGRLANVSGNLLGGTSGTTYYFKFSIWDNATVGSGSRLWPSSDPSSTSATVREGVFNVNIDVSSYDFNTNADIYMQVEVSSNNSTFETLSPRQRITSAVFSQIAARVSGTGQSSFGTTSPYADAIITAQASSTSSIPLFIKGFAGQVAEDLFRIVSSAGTKLFSVTASGSVILSNGFYLKNTGDITTMYDSADNEIMEFDTGQ